VLVHVVLYVAYALLNTAAMAAVKNAMQKFGANGRTAAVGTLAFGAVLYVGALGSLLYLLNDAEASTVFPIAIGCTVLATNAAGARFYKERITLQKIAGTLLLVIGIACTFLDGAAP
jgi:multidrug transporter EmrE-like cation transporter